MDSSLEYNAGDYLQAFRRRRKLMLKIGIPIIVLAATLALFLPDKYTSFASIDINLEGANLRELETIEVSSYADQYIAELQDRVLKYDKLIGLARQLGLVPENLDELPEVERSEIRQSAMKRIRRSVQVEVVTQKVASPGGGRQVQLITGFRAASVDPDPVFATEVARFLAREFLEADRLLRTERATSTASFLKEQMEITEKEILELEQDVADFKVANACCLPELVNLNTSVIQRAERDLDTMAPRIRTLLENRSFIQAQIDEIKLANAATDRLALLEQEYMTLVANYGPDHPDVNRVRREIVALSAADSAGGETFELIDLRARLREAEQKYSSEHPDVIRYKRQIAALEARVPAGQTALDAQLLDNPRFQNLRSQLSSVDTELNQLRRNQPELRAKIEEYQQRLARTPQVESEYQAIDRRLQSARENFDDLEKRSIVARQSEALESTDIGARLVLAAPAFMPREPSGPPRVAITILGLFLAATFGIGGMLFAETADNTVRSSKDLAVVMDMVPLAVIPNIQNSVSLAKRRRQLTMSVGTALVVVTAIAVLYFGVRS